MPRVPKRKSGPSQHCTVNIVSKSYPFMLFCYITRHRGESAFVLNSISIPLENAVFKLQGWVNYTPLGISHWQAHKNLHTAIGLISSLLAWT
ncbi:hypothetical protein TNCV_2849821 [Trichonephila clavipes]|nr:hypothetical protein TNCV_2849821 [Trichonephila clavipes]